MEDKLDPGITYIITYVSVLKLIRYKKTQILDCAHNINNINGCILKLTFAVCPLSLSLSQTYVNTTLYEKFTYAGIDCSAEEAGWFHVPVCLHSCSLCAADMYHKDWQRANVWLSTLKHFFLPILLHDSYQCLQRDMQENSTCSEESINCLICSTQTKRCVNISCGSDETNNAVNFQPEISTSSTF